MWCQVSHRPCHILLFFSDVLLCGVKSHTALHQCQVSQFYLSVTRKYCFPTSFDQGIFCHFVSLCLRQFSAFLVEKQRNQKVCLVQQNIWGKAGSGSRRFSEEGWTEMIWRLLFEVVLSRQFRSRQVIESTSLPLRGFQLPLSVSICIVNALSRSFSSFLSFFLSLFLCLFAKNPDTFASFAWSFLLAG